jgi:hypothetical protein
MLADQKYSVWYCEAKESTKMIGEAGHPMAT